MVKNLITPEDRKRFPVVLPMILLFVSKIYIHKLK